MKAKYDYRYLFIWMCAGNIVQFIANLIGEDRIKSIWSGKVYVLCFIFIIPFSLYLLGKTSRGNKIEASIKKNNKTLDIAGNISALIYMVYLLSLV